MPGGTQILEKGNTEYAAEFIQEALGADLFEIDTVKAYSSNYRECCKEAASEAKINARPEIKDYLRCLSVTPTGAAQLPCAFSPSWNIMI